MLKVEYQVKGGRVEYHLQRNKVCILSCKVEDSCFEIPSEIEGCPVTEIGKKAFLGIKTLKECVLPFAIEIVGEWAFAHCANLEKVKLSKKDISFGKGVFKDCTSLKAIVFHEEENLQIATLFAAAPVLLDAPYLLVPTEAGEENWLAKFDARLLALMEKPDREGYSRQVLCGEEDLMASLDLYLLERRKYKAKLCYLLLLHDIGLKEEVRNTLQSWLKAHTKGCESEAAWEVLLEEKMQGHALEQIFADAGCISEENFDGLLADMKEDYPEKKAWFLRYKEACLEKSDFFDTMIL